jgi:hypothetical protein
MTIIVKNVSGTNRTYAGQEIVASGSYTLQLSDVIPFQNSSNLMDDISNGDAVINDGIADISGTAEQIAYLFGVDGTPKDSDGATFVTNKACPSGWQFQKRYIEITTSELNSIKNNKANGTSWGDATIKFYDVNGTELTTQGACDTDCVKTVFSWEPSYSYSIIGGGVKTPTLAANDMDLWLTAVPDVPENMGGSKVMISQMNLKYYTEIHVDGRTGKILNPDNTYHTNKLQVVAKHSVGIKQKIIVNLEHFKS